MSLSPFACRLKRRDIGFRRSSVIAYGQEIGLADDLAIDDQHILCHLDAHRSVEVAETEWIEVLLAFVLLNTSPRFRRPTVHTAPPTSFRSSNLACA